MAISILSLYELHHWFAYDPSARTAADEIIREFSILPLPETGAVRFGALMRDLRDSIPRVEVQRRAVDCMIAITALENDAVLVSNDALFKDLAALCPALQIADWTVG